MLFLHWGSKEGFDVIATSMPELGPELGHLVEGVISQRAWSGGLVPAAGDSKKFGVALIFSKVYVELVLVVSG